MLLGNDLAGGKVVADPKVTSKTITLVITEKLEQVIPGIFPSCAEIRAMDKKAQEEPKDCKQSTDVLVICQIHSQTTITMMCRILVILIPRLG